MSPDTLSAASRSQTPARPPSQRAGAQQAGTADAPFAAVLREETAEASPPQKPLPAARRPASPAEGATTPESEGAAPASGAADAQDSASAIERPETERPEAEAKAPEFAPPCLPPPPAPSVRDAAEGAGAHDMRGASAIAAPGPAALPAQAEASPPLAAPEAEPLLPAAPILAAPILAAPLPAHLSVPASALAAAEPQAPAARATVESAPVLIASRAAEGARIFEMRLDPADLGRIDVSLHVGDDGRVRAHLTVEQPEALRLLRNDAPKLEQALAAAGLSPETDGLSFSLKQDGAGGERRSAPPFPAQNPGAGGPAEAPGLPVPAARLASLSRLDLML